MNLEDATEWLEYCVSSNGMGEMDPEAAAFLLKALGVYSTALERLAPDVDWRRMVDGEG